MLGNYFIVGLRSLRRDRVFSAINIFGLALATSAAIFIGLWVKDELSFNTYFRRYDQLGRVVRNIEADGEVLSRIYLPNALGDQLRINHSQVFEKVAMAYPVEDYFATLGDEQFSLRGQFMEPQGTAMLEPDIIEGTSALDDPHSIIISERTAHRLFESGHALNQQFTINNTMEVVVKGVYRDLPHNTDFDDAEFFAPLSLLASYEPWMKTSSFTQNYLHTYVIMKPHVSIEEASMAIKDVILKQVEGDREYAARHPQLWIQPMKDWHLYSEWKNGKATGGKARTVWMFATIGGSILLLACINFVNLSTARAERRTREVGVRKVIGSKRVQLIAQFMIESALVVLSSFVIAIVVCSACMHLFNQLTRKLIVMPTESLMFWLACAPFLLITILLAGSYPAFYLSSFDPAKVLTGLRVQGESGWPRKVLVVVQFSVSTILIIGTIVIARQVQFGKDRPVGYERSGLMMIPMIGAEMSEKSDVVRNELIASGVVNEVSVSSSPPTDIWSSNSGFDWEGKSPSLEPVFATITVSPEFGKTVGWTLIQGRDFDRNLASDSSAFVINSAAARVLGFADPIGKGISWETWKSKFNRFTVIGVVDDMLMGSPYDDVMPAVYFLSKETHHYMNLRVNASTSERTAVWRVSEVFNRIVPEVPFDYEFAAEEYDAKFATEVRVGKLVTLFSVLAIVISSLGLLGLSAYVAERRSKEICIRKILGASTGRMWRLLSGEFVLLAMAAACVALPIGYALMRTWLELFEHRVTFSWWMFVVPVAGMLVIVMITVSLQILKTAMGNPARKLRAE
ncbi:FtsX-like permease family protein [Chryseolinea sp. T2]|uniref:ABC transporter permease n=1 Tax=Chryseolinea sp. T2 TaxID=3129255 RepID=UPI0030787323